MRKIEVNSDLAPEPIGPYSQAIQVDNTLFVSGQIAINRGNGTLVDSDIASETHQVMKNLGFILEKAGMSFDQVVKCSIFISDMDNFTQINEVYGSYFTGIPPARETVEVAKLPKGVNVEISCIAVA